LARRSLRKAKLKEGAPDVDNAKSNFAQTRYRHVMTLMLVVRFRKSALRTCVLLGAAMAAMGQTRQET